MTDDAPKSGRPMPNRTQLLPDRPGVPPMADLPVAERIDPAEILAQADRPAFHRVELTRALLWAAMGLLLLDIAARRLGWDTALEKMRAGHEIKEKEPVKPKKQKQTKQKLPVSDTAQTLLDRQKNKKLL